MIGAHPDDCDFKGGGTAALLSARGYAIKFVSVTNGDAGHQSDKGASLARRRLAEAKEAGRRFGVEYDVLDNHDGQLMPTLEVRLQIIRKIREWNADIVIAPRPNDYHPDHRNTSLLVQDAAYMVTVPFICPDTPHLKDNPVFMYYTDRFRKPYPSEADVVVNIDGVIEKKLDALAVMESQFLEGGANGHEGLVPKSPEAKERRVAQVRQGHAALICAAFLAALLPVVVALRLGAGSCGSRRPTATSAATPPTRAGSRKGCVPAPPGSTTPTPSRATTGLPSAASASPARRG